MVPPPATTVRPPISSTDLIARAPEATASIQPLIGFPDILVPLTRREESDDMAALQELNTSPAVVIVIICCAVIVVSFIIFMGIKRCWPWKKKVEEDRESDLEGGLGARSFETVVVQRVQRRSPRHIKVPALKEGGAIAVRGKTSSDHSEQVPPPPYTPREIPEPNRMGDDHVRDSNVTLATGITDLSTGTFGEASMAHMKSFAPSDVEHIDTSAENSDDDSDPHFVIGDGHNGGESKVQDNLQGRDHGDDELWLNRIQVDVAESK